MRIIISLSIFFTLISSLFSQSSESYDIKLEPSLFTEKQSVAANGFKSLILPGWGNPERRWVYGSIELTAVGIVGFGILAEVRSDHSSGGLPIYGSTIIAGAILFVNRLIAPIDAMHTTAKHNYFLKMQKENEISFAPKYDPRNDQVGIGFAVNF